MTTSLDHNNVPALMTALGRDARQAARAVALASRDVKDKALRAAAAAMRARSVDIIAANKKDMQAAEAAGV